MRGGCCARRCVERFPCERIHQLRVASGDKAELCLGHQIAHDPQIFVAAPAHAGVAVTVHPEEPSRRAQYQVAHFVTVCVVVVLEAIVIDHLDAEAVATVLFTKGA